ncbi:MULTISPECIES: hypothetical protein [unclassified Streptomyces]|uniref:hypothetical protein n=1 Tax=unclassified Streptomyces TaxID=2593676 RepID=UPI00341E5AFC
MKSIPHRPAAVSRAQNSTKEGESALATSSAPKHKAAPVTIAGRISVAPGRGRRAAEGSEREQSGP